MEHIVDAGARRQGEADSNVVDELGDAVRPKERGLSLPETACGSDEAAC
jgi:hypothetical protein